MMFVACAAEQPGAFTYPDRDGGPLDSGVSGDQRDGGDDSDAAPIDDRDNQAEGDAGPGLDAGSVDTGTVLPPPPPATQYSCQGPNSCVGLEYDCPSDCDSRACYPTYPENGMMVRVRCGEFRSPTDCNEHPSSACKWVPERQNCQYDWASQVVTQCLGQSNDADCRVASSDAWEFFGSNLGCAWTTDACFGGAPTRAVDCSNYADADACQALGCNWLPDN